MADSDKKIVHPETELYLDRFSEYVQSNISEKFHNKTRNEKFEELLILVDNFVEPEGDFVCLDMNKTLKFYFQN